MAPQPLKNLELYSLGSSVDPSGFEAGPGARSAGDPFAPSRGNTSGRAVLERRTVHIPDVLADPEYTYDGISVLGFRTALGVPLMREDTVLAFVIFLVISEFLQMRRVIGGRTLNNLLLGRYHQPVREERVFILVDIKGSTPLAERLGDQRAHAFITSAFFDIDQPILEHGGSAFFDIDQPILEHGGEVYNYVGDELIASWPLGEGVDGARCVWCALAIQDALARRADDYRRIFGSAPAVRIVLHAGPVVAGECGDAKLAIVYLGDTLNTAARIEEMAKAIGRDCVISDALLAQIDLPPSLGVEPLGSIQLRGRQQPVILHALHATAVPLEAAAECDDSILERFLAR